MRRVRRLGILLAVAALCVAVVLLVAGRRRRTVAGPRGGRIPADADLSQPTVLPNADPDDPSQLVQPWLLFAEPHGNPLRRINGGLQTLIDHDTLALVLQAVKDVPQAELADRADPNIAWEDFVDKNRRERIRGRVCRFSGTLWRLEVNNTVAFPEIGIERLYEGQILDAPGGWYSFYCFEDPGKIGRADVATVTGVFYKLIKYPTRGGEEMVTPLIIARTITSRPGPRPPKSVTQRMTESAPPWALYAGLGVAAIVAFIVTGLVMRRRPSAVYRRRGG